MNDATLEENVLFSSMGLPHIDWAEIEQHGGLAVYEVTGEDHDESLDYGIYPEDCTELYAIDSSQEAIEEIRWLEKKPGMMIALRFQEGDDAVWRVWLD